MTLWLARSGKYGEYEEKFLQDNVIHMTWDGLENHDLSGCKSRADILRVLESAYREESKSKIGNWAGQISVFTVYMQPGDWFVMPLKHKPAIAIGEIVSDYRFDPKAKEPFKHIRQVKWIDKAVPRSRFDQDLLYSFGAFMTFCEIRRNDAEARVKALLGKAAPKEHQADNVPDDSGAFSNIEELARDQLAKHIIRKFQGDKLERLVEAVLQAQGYTTYHSPTGPDKGVDILAAPGALGFGSPRICVQVKSSESPIDLPTLHQLRGTMEDVKADQGLLVAWGGFKSSVEKERARNFFSIRLWDQSDLIREIQTHYDKLDAGLRADLPLKQIWVVAEEEQ